jgi:hypothetical protein
VAAATNSPTLENEVEVGALLASLPETGDELWSDDRWPTRTGLQPLMDMMDLGGRLTFSAGRLLVALVADEVNSAEDLAAFAAHYPSLANREPRLPVLLPSQKPGRVEWPTPYGKAIQVEFAVPTGSVKLEEDYGAVLDEIAPQYRWMNRRWLRPAVEDDAPPPSPLMTWWAILFALSMLARYHPTAWTRALDENSSPIAVNLERSLDIALEAVPHLVFEAVLLAGGGPLLLPPGPSTPPVGM